MMGGRAQCILIKQDIGPGCMIIGVDAASVVVVAVFAELWILVFANNDSNKGEHHHLYQQQAIDVWKYIIASIKIYFFKRRKDAL